MRIVVCGGGGLGHTCSAILSLSQNVVVDLLTNHPDCWNHEFRINTPDEGTIVGKIDRISSEPATIIPEADIVLLCLPAFLIEEMIVRIKPYLNKQTVVGAVFGCTGFFLYAHHHLPFYTKLFAFQRVPFISRIVEYGCEANLLGYRNKLIMAVENVEDSEQFRKSIEYLFREPVELCDSFYEVTFSNSNPILHTGRLYDMWKNWDGTPFDSCSLFYNEWTVEASQLEIEMDKEFFALLEALHVKTTHIETLLEHYESTDAVSMTAKIKSLESLATIKSPMKLVEGGWLPDFSSRYFVEDFPFGLKNIYDLAIKNNIECPYIRKVLEWGMSKMSN